MSTVNSTSSTSQTTGVTDPFAPRTNTKSSDQTGATKDLFLKLLVAQIKNQDPLNPADGIQFVTQLAQFTQLEQTISMSTDLHSIRGDLEKTAQSADGSNQAAGTGQ